MEFLPREHTLRTPHYLGWLLHKTECAPAVTRLGVISGLNMCTQQKSRPPRTLGNDLVWKHAILHSSAKPQFVFPETGNDDNKTSGQYRDRKLGGAQTAM